LQTIQPRNNLVAAVETSTRVIILFIESFNLVVSEGDVNIKIIEEGKI